MYLAFGQIELGIDSVTDTMGPYPLETLNVPSVMDGDFRSTTPEVKFILSGVLRGEIKNTKAIIGIKPGFNERAIIDPKDILSSGDVVVLLDISGVRPRLFVLISK